MSSSDSSSRSRSRQKGNGKRVYVTGYSLKQDTHDLKKLFKKYGKIQEFAWKGKYCFIEFYKEDDAKKAVKKLNKEDINGYTLVVELAKGRKQSSNVCYACGRSGHFAKSCKRKPRSSSSSSDSSEKKYLNIQIYHKKQEEKTQEREEEKKKFIVQFEQQQQIVQIKQNPRGARDRRSQMNLIQINIQRIQFCLLMSENKHRNINKRMPHKQLPILKENSVYLNQSPIRKSKEQCAQRNLEAISSFQTLQSEHKKGKSVIDATDFGGWDDAPTIIPENNSRKSCSQQVQRNKLIPYVQKQRKFTPKKIMLKMSQVPSPMIEYPIQRRLDTLNNQLLMLQGMSEFFGNDRFNKVLQGMNSVVLSRRVKRGNRVLSSKSFM